MHPSLWGPGLWQALFACAWCCRKAHGPALSDVILRLLPLLLPCEKCRLHFAAKRAKVKRRARGDPLDAATAFRWLYYLKDEVNQTAGLRSPPLEVVQSTYAFHGPLVDDVRLGDALVLVALEAHELGRGELCAELCRAFAMLLPLPADSELRRHLARVEGTKPVVPQVVRAARAARVERGLPQLSLAHYRDSSA